MQIDNRRVDLIPGMAATVEIKTGKRRIISYLLSPIHKHLHEAFGERQARAKRSPILGAPLTATRGLRAPKLEKNKNILNRLERIDIGKQRNE
jgi:hypothetical protein